VATVAELCGHAPMVAGSDRLRGCKGARVQGRVTGATTRSRKRGGRCAGSDRPSGPAGPV
jgi:hypothetical protein